MAKNQQKVVVATKLEDLKLAVEQAGTTVSVPPPAAAPATPKINRPSFRKVTIDPAAKEERLAWKSQGVEMVRALVQGYAKKTEDPEAVVLLPVIDAEGKPTGEEEDASAETILDEIGNTLNAVTDRGARETFVIAAMDAALEYLPKTEGGFEVNFSELGITTGFYRFAERGSPEVKRGAVNWFHVREEDGTIRKNPLASDHADSGRIMKAAQGFVDTIVRNERRALYEGAKSLLEALRSGEGNAAFFKKGSPGSPSGDFLVSVKNQRVLPVAASESYREDVEEMKSLGVFISCEDLRKIDPDLDPGRKLPKRKFELLRGFYSVVSAALDAELEDEKQSGQRATAKARAEAERKVRQEAREAEKVKTMEMKSREGLISQEDLLVRGAEGDAFFHLMPSRVKAGTVFSAFTWKGKRYHHVAGILRKSGVNVAVVDCLPSNEELFAAIHELTDPGEKFVNFQEPAGMILRKLYAIALQRDNHNKARVSAPQGTAAPEAPASEASSVPVETTPPEGTEATTATAPVAEGNETPAE